MISNEYCDLLITLLTDSTNVKRSYRKTLPAGKDTNKFLKSDKLRVYLWRNKSFLVLHQENSDLLTKHFQQSIQVKRQYLWHWLLVTFLSY